MEKLLLIDGDSLLYYEGFKEQSLEEAKLNIYKRLNIILKATKTNKYAAFLSCSENFRHSIAKTRKYKSGRNSSKPKLFYDLKNFVLSSLGFKIIKGYEADDLVIYYSHKLQKEYDCVICSPDKDVLYQKQGVHFNFQFKEVNGKFNLGNFINVSNQEVNYFKNKQLLTGDSVDAIVGIPKIGSIKADKILKDVKDENLIIKVFIEYLNYFKNEHLAINKFCENVNLLQMIKDDEMIEYLGLNKLNKNPFIVNVTNVQND
jgi:5'-3' exonuclease